MKTKETIKNNKLIAKFMGQQTRLLDHPANVSGYNYHSSWDRLMPVIQKILDLSFQDGKNAEDFYNIRDCVPDINHTYKAVIEYIKGI